MIIDDPAMLGGSGYARIENDAYFTPPENVDCLLAHVSLRGMVWEPACGDGAISKRLMGFDYTTLSSDLVDRGFGTPNVNFLATTAVPHPDVRSIVTNPPYGDLVEKFIVHGLKMMEPVRGQVCLFLRNEYDCGSKRAPLFNLPPFHKKIVVTKRPRWIADSDGSPRHNYSWFVWDWRHIKGPASIVYSHPKTAKPLSRVQ